MKECQNVELQLISDATDYSRENIMIKNRGMGIIGEEEVNDNEYY